MATQQALRSQPCASHYPEPLDGFISILRARRLEPASPCKKNGKVGLVEAQREKRQHHRQSLSSPFRSRSLSSLFYSFSSRNNSSASAAYGASAVLLFGCMTMSHPAGISCRWHRTISRTRLRMRLRTTAPPSALLMLKPNRLCGNSFARKKTVKWELDRRFPARYTASNSALRTSRALRGYSCPPWRACPSLLGRKAMASLLAARRQDSSAAHGLHACAEAVRLGSAAFPRLIRALWQSNPP